jgi:hypothetical protein
MGRGNHILLIKMGFWYLNATSLNEIIILKKGKILKLAEPMLSLA